MYYKRDPLAPVKFLIALVLAASGALAVLYAHRIPAAVDIVNQLKYRWQIYQYTQHSSMAGSPVQASEAPSARQWGYTGAPAPGESQSGLNPAARTAPPGTAATPPRALNARERLLKRKPIARKATAHKPSVKAKSG
jgi:hypothetical protein